VLLFTADELTLLLGLWLKATCFFRANLAKVFITHQVLIEGCFVALQALVEFVAKCHVLKALSATFCSNLSAASLFCAVGQN
jgi:hypothetical protein